ncbi:protein-L-isoaspartate O-methyltransferase [Kitasatospora sp. NPDC059571]|uniref:protein-L-isoaspartate O-methyltransferase family protein n=1 Tax=Kitasatospora sp. NPDC059571 TaxID=3346871 RepID=UPI00368DB97B
MSSKVSASGTGDGPNPGGMRAEDTLAAELAFVRAVAAEPGVVDAAVVAAMGAVPRHLLIPRLFEPRGPVRPARLWRLVDPAVDRAAYLAAVYGTDQVVVQLDGAAPDGQVVGDEYLGTPTAMSSGAGLIALALQDLRVAPGDRFVEVGAATFYLSAVAARLTGCRVLGVEIDRRLTGAAVPRLARIGAAVQALAGDASDALPPGMFDRICGSFALPAVPTGWLRQLAPGGRLRVTISTGAPGWHGTALVDRDARTGALSGRLAAERWGHLPARGRGWLPLPPQTGPGRDRTHTTPPPGDHERGFWLAVAHLLPGVRRHWTDGEVVLVAADGSRAVLAPDGTGVREWGPRSLWAEAEHVHARWTAAGRPDTYALRFDGDRQWADGGPGLGWPLPGPRPAPHHRPTTTTTTTTTGAP